MKTTIKKCSKCGDGKGPGETYQNQQYGDGNRVHNNQGAKKKDQTRCTVCGNETSK